MAGYYRKRKSFSLALAEEAKHDAWDAALAAEQGRCGSALFGIALAYEKAGYAKHMPRSDVKGDLSNKLTGDLHRQLEVVEKHCLINRRMF